MSDNVASDVARRLADEGFGSITPPEPTIYANTYPPDPDELIAVHHSTGFDPEEAMGTTVMEVYNLQVLVRALTATAAVNMSMDLWRFLHRFRGTIEGVHYPAIWARSMPFPLGRDENKRWQWTCNYIARRRHT